MTDNSKTSCRPSLVIFVDTTGINIFQEFNSIKEVVGFDGLLQKYTGLIFYRSNPQKAFGRLYDSDIPSVDNLDGYTFTLKDAIHEMLTALTDEAIKDTLKNGGFDVQSEPQIFIVGNSSTTSPGLVLKTVREVRTKQDQSQVYYILSGPPGLDRSPLIREMKESIAVNSNVQQKMANFSYVYPYTSKQTQKGAFYAAGCALFTLINTGITSQSSFQHLIQHLAQKTGVLRTSFITFPGREMKSYFVKQLTSDLLDKWMPEEIVLASLQAMKNMTKLVPLPDATKIESVPLVEMTGTTPKVPLELERVSQIMAEKQSHLPVYLDTRTLSLFSTSGDINKLYSEAYDRKNNTQAEAWTVFLARETEKKLNVWKQEAEANLETMKADALSKICKEVIFSIWEQPFGVQRIKLAQDCINLLKQQLATLRENNHSSIANANPDQQATIDLQTLQKQVEQTMAHMPSPSTLVTAAILALVVLSFLILTQTSSLTGTLVLWIGILVALPSAGFFLWHRQRIKKAQRRLIKQTRQETLSNAEKFKSEQRIKFVETLSSDLLDCLKEIRNWLENKKEQFKQEADQELKQLCKTLAASSHRHICNHKLLLKNESDSETLREYYEGQIRVRINVNKSENIQARGGVSLTQLVLYTRLFDSFLSARSVEKGRNERADVPVGEKKTVSEELSDFVTDIIDEFQGKKPDEGLKNVPEYLYRDLDEKQVWEHLLNTLINSATAGSSTPSLVFICGCGPDMKTIQKRIKKISIYKQRVVVPVRTRTINQYWFFVVALFCDGSLPLNAHSLPTQVESSPLRISGDPPRG